MKRLILSSQILSVLIAMAFVASSQGQELNRLERSEDWLLPMSDVDADPNIPSSKSLLGYRWGEEISNHAQIEAYLRALHRAAPNRTRLVEYGETYESRPLYYLVISSESNLANLETIREANLALANPATGDDVSETLESNPAFVWLAYSVHGNEISCSDAALLTAYHFLADQRAETQAMLDDVVIFIDPLQNPDGRERFVSAFREARGLFPQSNPAANEHTERWPGGRQNHYWFDMNRDWFRQSQMEVRAKVAAYLHWSPQVYVDAHEMGRNSTYYFAPPADPINPYLLPRQHDWFFRIGSHQASRFDEFGFSYTTREMFDAFYPGYGSEWPTLQGGLGVLWEQASARGIVVDRDDESQLRYSDGVRHHYVSGVATVEVAAANRRLLLEDFRDAREQAMRLGTEGDVRHFFLLTGSNPDRAESLAVVLQNNGIDVRKTVESLHIEALGGFSAETTQRSIPAGSFHVPVAQPTGRLIRTLLDREVSMDDAFVQRQLARNEHRLPDEIYDVTAWSLPLAFGVESLAVGEADVSSEPWNMEEVVGEVVGGPARVAYLIKPTDRALEALAWLHQNDIRVRVANRWTQFGDRRYPRGTLIVRVNENDETLADRMNEMAALHQIVVECTDTGFPTDGAHLGGPHVSWVRPPRTLIVCQEPISYSVGHTWYLMDQGLQYPSTRVAANALASCDLDQFNVMVFAEGRYSGHPFNDSLIERIKNWVSDGGTLITFKNATRWATSEDVQLLANEIKRKEVKLNESDEEPVQVSPDSAPGAFLRANVFNEHFLSYGCPEEMTLFYTGSLILSPTPVDQGRSVVTFADQESILSSGFCWPSTLELQAESPYAVAKRHGSGHVIGFTDDPNFRAMYPVSQRLFINAVMFGPSF